MENLQQWLHSALSSSELEQAQGKYTRQGFSGEIGDVLPRNYIKHLYTIAGWFISQPVIAEKLLQKATSLAEKKEYTYLDKHHLYSEAIKIYYRHRTTEDFQIRAIKACVQQIRIAPHTIRELRRISDNSSLPTHTGYNQLALILEEDKRYDNAIALCKQAIKQGWPDDWQSRITHYQRQLSQQQLTT
uniref:Tetratricopeptide repeat protein n=1 Tax=uncultured Thiotrichaceae bacterium TaxID=298394 RepID=A0A6S6UKM2_9GAMM|nr:MAG: Unknown protein [uncultured Thiotrichaceae bacterium]